MNRLKTLTLLGAIFAVTMGALSYNAISATPLLISSVPSTHDYVKALGHVEYTVADSSGLVKAYYQGDNLVVNQGDNCAAARLFDPTDSATNGCTSFGSNGFQYIAIGNKTSSYDDASVQLAQQANSTSDGEQARRRDNTPIFTVSSTNSTSGAQVVIETPTPFTFGSGNATTVRNAALFDSAATADANGQTTAVTGKMFSVQNLSPAVTVSSGDTLNVKWTITIGTNDAAN